MNFWKYIDEMSFDFWENYLDKGLVNVQHHKEFPLDIYSYSRECMHSGTWDKVTTKCRGIIVHRETGEIIARPFEKFFNLRTAGMPETDPSTWYTDADVAQGGTCDHALFGQPEVWEKMDGFLCTMYEWEGKHYIASKGSFDSPHAKWATAWYQKNVKDWPDGYTPVFEGITPNLRIVVDYATFEGLVLLALVNKETGEELEPYVMHGWANRNGVEDPRQFPISWQDAAKKSLDTEVENFEGYVLVWRRAGKTPFRLKVKYIDYLRLHRLVTGVSPKRILEALRDGFNSDIDEMINNSTPGFSHWVKKWKGAIEHEYNRIEIKSVHIFNDINSVLHSQYLSTGVLPTKKDFALLVNSFEGNEEFSGVLFSMYNGKDTTAVIWAKVRRSPIMAGGHPMVDAHSI